MKGVKRERQERCAKFNLITFNLKFTMFKWSFAQAILAVSTAAATIVIKIVAFWNVYAFDAFEPCLLHSHE